MKNLTLYSALWADFHPFVEFGLFEKFVEVTHPDELDGPGMLVVHGGEDISPSLYNKGRSYYSGADDEPSRRDRMEWALMQRAVEKGIPIFGICRGAQMLCALAGGYLIQDVTNHGRTHNIKTREGFTISVNSCHHQMMAPWDTKHEVIATADVKYSKHYYDVNDKVDVPYESEFIHFPEQKGIAVQWHPEWLSHNCESNLYIKQFVKEYFDGTATAI